MANINKTEHPWHQHAPESLHMKHLITGAHGPHMGKMDGTEALLWNIIVATQFTSMKLEAKE
jgi:hypothetical protein